MFSIVLHREIPLCPSSPAFAVRKEMRALYIQIHGCHGFCRCWEEDTFGNDEGMSISCLTAYFPSHIDAVGVSLLHYLRRLRQRQDVLISTFTLDKSTPHLTCVRESTNGYAGFDLESSDSISAGGLLCKACRASKRFFFSSI